MQLNWRGEERKFCTLQSVLSHPLNNAAQWKPINVSAEVTGFLYDVLISSIHGRVDLRVAFFQNIFFKLIWGKQ